MSVTVLSSGRDPSGRTGPTASPSSANSNGAGSQGDAVAGIAARDPVRLTPASAAYRPSRAITQHTLDAGSRLDSTARVR